MLTTYAVYAWPTSNFHVWAWVAYLHGKLKSPLWIRMSTQTPPSSIRLTRNKAKAIMQQLFGISPPNQPPPEDTEDDLDLSLIHI